MLVCSVRGVVHAGVCHRASAAECDLCDERLMMLQHTQHIECDRDIASASTIRTCYDAAVVALRVNVLVGVRTGGE